MSDSEADLVDRVYARMGLVDDMFRDRNAAEEIIRIVRETPRPMPAPVPAGVDPARELKALDECAHEHALYRSVHRHNGRDTWAELRAAAMKYAAIELDVYGAPASAQLARDIADLLSRKD